MSTTDLPLESDNVSPNLGNKSLSQNVIDTNHIYVATSEVSISSSQSLVISNLAEIVTKEISVIENKMALSQREEKSIDNSEDKNSSSSQSSKSGTQDHFSSQKDQEDFSKEDSSSNTFANSNSQKESQEKVEDKSNEQEINKINDKVLGSDDDDDYTSFKLNTSSKSGTKKTFAIVDSESDEEIFPPKEENNEKEETNSVSEISENRDTTKSKKKSRLMNISDLDSDSEDEMFFKSKKENNEKEETGSISASSENRDTAINFKKKSRLTNILDSESDDDSVNKEEKSQDQTQKSNFKKLLDSDSSAESSDDQNSVSHDEKKKKVQSKKASNVLKNLVDSDDSEPDERNENDRVLSDASDENKTEGKSKGKAEKRRVGSARASKDAAMKEIHSETQRLLRESEVSLPYHRPKQRTLQEFLNRKKISSSLPKAPTTAAKVKMFADLVSKAVEEKEKEVEEFYKSSDSEEEMQSAKKDNDGIEKPKESTDLKELENPMEVDPFNENDQKSPSASIDPPEILPSSNLNSTEQVDQVLTIEEKTIETPLESTALNNSVSRKLFVDEGENKTPESTSQESQKACETSVQDPEDENEAGNTEDSHAMETDTNDFELRFSTADFDTNLQLLDLENKNEESVLSGGIEETEKSDSNEMKVSEIPAILEEEINKENIGEKEKMEDDLSASPKGHVIGLPPPDLEDNLPKKTLMKKIPSCYLKGKPTLRGSPGTTIDFDLDVKSNHDGINKLVDRFVRHSQTHKSEENADVMVMHTEVTTDGLKISEAALPYKRMSAAEDNELNKPGAKLKKLREELEQKMSIKRNEEWRQREEASKALDEYLGEEIEPEDKDELLLDEEEELDDESAESEPEENDVILKENKKSKCEFADDEAEVSENEENLVDGEREDDEDEEIEETEENEDEEEEELGKDIEKEDEEEVPEHPKKLRRITTAFEDDSNLSEPEDPEKETANVTEAEKNSRKNFHRSKTDVDMFGDVSDGWTSDNEDETCPKIKDGPLTCQTPVIKPIHLSLISPITQLTALNKSTDSAKKDSSSKESDSLDQMNDSLSQEPNSVEKHSQVGVKLDKWCGSQKKLFQDPPDAINVDDLKDLCSGDFGETPSVKKDLEPLMNPSMQSKVTDSQLLDLCSRSFSSEPVSKESEKAVGMDEDSQDITLTFDEESRSPRKTSPKKSVDLTLLGSRLKVVSSDEEDEVENDERAKKGKKKIVKLVLSDEEDENNEGSELSEEEGDEEEEEEEQFVDYDSEENEVVMIPKKDIKKVAKKFLENEAELSESDWDSADEDERDLDKLEREAGDDDVIDEDQMRNQLGKIHARQVLDDDQREVRLLQDMLFEDGDLHSEGAGRERKFKWKNIDTLGSEWDESKVPEDQEMIAEAMEDHTSEIEFRKMRFEQEKFLEMQKKNSADEIEDVLNDSPIFKVGLRVVNSVKCSISSSKTEESAHQKLNKPLAPSIIPSLLEKPATVKTSTIQYAMRGSFLARGEEALARIASIIDEKDRVVRAPVNGRRFVFEHISPSVKDTEEIKTDEEVSTSNKRSRKRTSTSDSTPKSAKKLKVDKQLSAGKKLFSS